MCGISLVQMLFLKLKLKIRTNIEQHDLNDNKNTGSHSAHMLLYEDPATTEFYFAHIRLGPKDLLQLKEKPLVKAAFFRSRDRYIL